MTKTDANPPMPLWSDEYQLVEVDADYLAKAVKPKQFIHIDQSECISCEGCVDICPWKCIHMVSLDAVDDAIRNAASTGLISAEEADILAGAHVVERRDAANTEAVAPVRIRHGMCSTNDTGQHGHID